MAPTSCGFLFRNDNTTVMKTTLMVLPSHFKHSSSRVMSYAINFLNYLRNRVHPHAWKCISHLVCLWCQSGRWHRHHADFSSEMTTRLWLSLTGVTHISLQKWQHDCDWVRLKRHTPCCTWHKWNTIVGVLSFVKRCLPCGSLNNSLLCTLAHLMESETLIAMPQH